MEENTMEKGQEQMTKRSEFEEAPMILEEIEIEELFIDGICGVY
jgi:mycofactocin precursor